MGRNVRFAHSPKGIAQVMKSAGVRSELARRAARIEASANALYGLPTPPEVDPYGSNVEEHGATAVGRVYTRTVMGRVDNAENNTLLKARG